MYAILCVSIFVRLYVCNCVCMQALLLFGIRYNARTMQQKFDNTQPYNTQCCIHDVKEEITCQFINKRYYGN